jgi:glucokinase
MNNHLLAIEIGGSKLQLFVGDESANILQRHRFQVDPAHGGTGIRRQIETALKPLLALVQPGAVGVGFGGPVDGRAGRICCSHQVEGWADFELGAWLRELTGRPVVIENDSNVAALGEAMRGAGQGSDPMFYFNMGSGVGGGLIVNRSIYHGAVPGEVEFGHLRLDRDGTTVESRCSGWAVDRRIRALRETAPDSMIVRLLDKTAGCEARYLAAALERADAVAQRLLTEIAADLAFALSHVVHLFHPEVVVMGGGLAQVGEPLRNAVATALPPLIMEAFRPGPSLRLAGLGQDSVPVGALLLAQREQLAARKQ